MSEKFSLIQFFKQYPNEAAAVRYFEELRWSDGVKCPHCGSTRIANSKYNMPYRCKDCRKHFSVRVGTILEDSKLPLLKWLLAIYILTNSKKGISSIQLAEYLECTQKTAWFLAHRIREAWLSSDTDKLSGTVEVDETYIGGREKNKHYGDKLRAGRGAVGKIPVVGLKSRSGQIKAFAVKRTDKTTLHSAINNNVIAGARVFTDQYNSYSGLKGFDHCSVDHSAREYVRGIIHTNGIESFWAILKRGYHGIYHSWSIRHLQRYINEFAARCNMHDATPFDRIQKTIVGGYDKRLSYRKLING